MACAELSRACAPAAAPAAVDAARWAAVRARDPEARFIYAVRSTGVYCRPDCPSRQARPEHVLFFDDAAAARAAGFRACRRCDPDGPGRAARRAQQVAALCRHIEACEAPPPLEALAREAGLSPAQLRRVFRAATGLTPRGYAQALRARRLQSALQAESTVTSALFGAGFGSSGRFYAQSDALLGMAPGRYRAGGAGMNVRFAVAQCALGALLVACSERGVCAISLGDDADALVRELQDRFPQARLHAGDADFDALVARVVALVEDPRAPAVLPLDIRGTAFQQRVWQALQQIPPGQTLSYAELAARIGAAAAVRAVAGACAANVLAVAVPCHRIVRRDGSLSGYRWGVERKRALLAREAEGAETGLDIGSAPGPASQG
ncbi:bifunctional DNA-binding transcriptional regulator/O6-methylguanine-DNA methyltransferase Ada [Azohydromonas aeria]|uniref:bifunctional DNA-binding transcriptional regulator/O6-methylguanine-DNA methyltransferase Ada n=1 Tax=Azohydromonas aeria TaxID=2590212 RepID=UPI0012FCB26B|nr:bifunctional DNA-binding transcriptional regulator/O6-methylguanine-DNA methyltransferase Ada [Azohydromonas aeria]